jgi:hypothetical protein
MKRLTLDTMYTFFTAGRNPYVPDLHVPLYPRRIRQSLHPPVILQQFHAISHTTGSLWRSTPAIFLERYVTERVIVIDMIN